MADRRKAHLDALESRLTCAKRIALFGHRAVGKTTLLAMFYREASTGRVPGVRLAAVDPPSAEYLAEKVAQIEAGEPPAGTLAETELRLRLYRGPGRLDLVVKDYQGEHVALGTDEPSIREFFADCDAVLLCLDPDGSASPADRRRRQQEVENLLERYIERSDDATTDRPIALLVTKYDRVLAHGGPPPEEVERLVEARYGMTRHALACHAPRNAVFAVSSYGREAGDDGRPPSELHPLGLEGPLGWLADQLEAVDVERLEWLWDLVPGDLPRLARCVRAFERRYPTSDRVDRFRDRLKALRRKRLRAGAVRLALVATVLVAALAGYDLVGYQRAVSFERDNPPKAVAQRWADLLAWHPSLPWFWPERARQARWKSANWDLEEAKALLARGKDVPDLSARIDRAADQAPQLAIAAREVEHARDRLRHDERWRALEARAGVPGEDPDPLLADARAFLRDFSWTPHRAEATALIATAQKQADERRSRAEGQEVEALRRAGELPNAELAALIEQSQGWLDHHPDSRLRGEMLALQGAFADRLDRNDFDKALAYSRLHTDRYQNRIDRYQDYLDAHKSGGRFVREAMAGQERARRDWDSYSYRQAYDHLAAHPDDVAEAARRLRDYLRHHKDGRHVGDAEAYLKWWEKVSTTGEYHVTLRRGEVEPGVGKYLSGGAPDLSVVVEVAGQVHGPSPVIKNSRRPIWDYTFPRPIRWKLGDPVTIRIVDNDWSASDVFTLHSAKDDPLSIRLLSGTIQPSKGGKTSLVFSSDFQMPNLTKPD
ncbi:MAG TPA: hypothetical protein VG406_11850 [Isosphaeraceae bacterium]|jgi:GTPase SAR1 family protein|nr:hypothetical protein [Isosphaeraceae bacterium]